MIASWTSRLTISLIALLGIAAASAPAAEADAPPLLSQFCHSSKLGGECEVPQGIAVDQATGHLFVIDNSRINEFTAWGKFVKAWGGGVLTGGATGTGVVKPGLTTVSSVTTTSKAFLKGMAIEGTGIAPGTRIVGIELAGHALTLSQPATAEATGAATALSSPEAPGNVPVDELQKITLTATAGTFKLRFKVEAPSGSDETTTSNLPYNASAAEVQAALETLGAIAPGDVAVTSSNPGGEAGVPGGPYTVEFRGRFADTDVMGLMVVKGEPPLSGGEGTVRPIRQGASAPEVCTGGDCRPGVDGPGPGQFTAGMTGIAVDSQGDVYVHETAACTGGEKCEEEFSMNPLANNRVQKFDSDGNFLLMIGGGVDKGPNHPGNLCMAAYITEGDTCGGGAQGSGDSEFGVGPNNGNLEPLKARIAVGPDDDLYVGGYQRIQVFDPDGHFLRKIPLPGEMVAALAVDNDPASPSYGDLYASYYAAGASRDTKEKVRKLDPLTGATLGTLEVVFPKAIAADPLGRVYVYQLADNTSGKTLTQSEIIEFDPSGKQVLSFPQPEIGSSQGLAASTACGIDGADIFIANRDSNNPFINLYGSLPDANICPPPVAAPSIDDQFVAAGDSGGATLRAKINPHFWPDTRYYVEYGTEPCSLGGCDREQPAVPGSLLTKDTLDGDLTTASVFLSGLEPATTYHFRFVAQSGGGGPVHGRGGTETQDGAEASFHTSPLGSEPDSGCPNQPLRGGASAKLPDCRAYELVSPLDKNNGDVALNSNPTAGRANFAQAAVDGERMTFSSATAFPDAEGAWLSNQYLSERTTDGWLTRAISPPRDTHSFYPNVGSNAFPYKAFSPSLCSGWLVTGNEIALAPGAPAGVPNLYRRDFCGPGGYELLTNTPPPGFGGEIEGNYYPEPQGFSADEAHTVFRADAALAVAPGDPAVPLHCTSESNAEAISYAWLRGGAQIPGATAPTYTPVPQDAGTAVQCQVRASGAEGASTQASKPQLIAPAPTVKPPAITRAGSEVDAIPNLMAKGVAISGTPAVGQTLTCNPSDWSGSPSFTYQWLKGAAQIPGATAPTYTPGPADRGTAIQCELSAANPGGTVLADSPLALVGASPPVATAQPAISGTPAVGQTLTCNPGTWSGTPSFTYAWFRGATQISGATTSTHLLLAEDEGKAIQCRVRAANSSAAVLAPSAAVVVAPPPGSSPPAQSSAGEIEGTAHVGEALSCDPGTWSGTPTFAFKWLRNGVGIAGATEAEYELSAEDRAKAIQCQVTASNAGGAVVAITAAAYVDPNPPPAPGASAYSVYEVYETSPGGALHLVSVQPDGTPAAGHSAVGTAQSGEGQTDRNSSYNAVSADGSRVFWTENDHSGAPGTSEGSGDQPGNLYLRMNATAEQSAVSAGQCTEADKACTIPISATPALKARFISADREGTRVLYAKGNSQFGDELYEATIGEAGGKPQASSQLIAQGIISVMGASEDASRIYFASTEEIPASGPNPLGAEPQAGKPNLYLHAAGAGTEFVGTLADGDTFGLGLGGGGFPTFSPLSLLPAMRSARVSPDGRYAAFTSVASLTGYDNTDLNSGVPDTEVFRYDAQEDELLCVSCKPSGARPTGVDFVFENGRLLFGGAAHLPGWPSQTTPSHVLSDNGRRAFFNAYDALVPGDTNGREDVYEWEAPGEGSCSEAKSAFSEANGGCIYLITSGQSPANSEIFDVTPTGTDVFFATQSSLLPQDFGLRDVYDARINGGLPGPATLPAGCEGEACQGAPAPPNDPTPASAVFQGAGNVKESPTKPRCVKGKVRKKVRCVTKRKAKKKKSADAKRATPDRRNAR